MSEPPPGSPADQQPPQPRRGGGSLVLGIAVGVLFFAALVVLTIAVPNVAYSPIPQAALVIAYLAIAGVLAVRPRSARFGSGLLIAIGVSILLSAGVCVVLITGIGRLP